MACIVFSWCLSAQILQNKKLLQKQSSAHTHVLACTCAHACSVPTFFARNNRRKFVFCKTLAERKFTADRRYLYSNAYKTNAFTTICTCTCSCTCVCTLMSAQNQICTRRSIHTHTHTHKHTHLHTHTHTHTQAHAHIYTQRMLELLGGGLSDRVGLPGTVRSTPFTAIMPHANTVGQNFFLPNSAQSSWVCVLARSWHEHACLSEIRV
jgi:hypothetical protein